MNKFQKTTKNVSQILSGASRIGLVINEALVTQRSVSHLFKDIY